MFASSVELLGSCTGKKKRKKKRGKEEGRKKVEKGAAASPPPFREEDVAGLYFADRPPLLSLSRRGGEEGGERERERVVPAPGLRPPPRSVTMLYIHIKHVKRARCSTSSTPKKEEKRGGRRTATFDDYQRTRPRVRSNSALNVVHYTGGASDVLIVTMNANHDDAPLMMRGKRKREGEGGREGVGSVGGQGHDWGCTLFYSSDDICGFRLSMGGKKRKRKKGEKEGRKKEEGGYASDRPRCA